MPNVILISLHINAAGDGTKWINATGWSCYTCKGQTESDRLADCLYKAAEQILKNHVIRTDYARHILLRLIPIFEPLLYLIKTKEL